MYRILLNVQLVLISTTFQKNCCFYCLNTQIVIYKTIFQLIYAKIICLFLILVIKLAFFMNCTGLNISKKIYCISVQFLLNVQVSKLHKSPPLKAQNYLYPFFPRVQLLSTVSASLQPHLEQNPRRHILGALWSFSAKNRQKLQYFRTEICQN